MCEDAHPCKDPPGGVAEQRRAEEVLVREEDCRPVRGPSPCRRWRRCFKGRLPVVVERGSDLVQRSCAFLYMKAGRKTSPSLLPRRQKTWTVGSVFVRLSFDVMSSKSVATV
jgi:hypothetical protein